jgi:hypothetical protein
MGGACIAYKTVEQEILGRTKRLLSFDTPRAAYKTTRPAVLLFYVYILCRGNVYTEPLSSNERGLHIYTQGLRGGNYIERH